MLMDLFLVRDLGWVMDNVRGKRFWVNFALSAFVLWVLLFNLRDYWRRHRKTAVVLLAACAAAYFAQSAYFGIYRKFVTVFDFRFFVGDPLMTVELWLEHGEKVRPAITALLASGLLWWVMCQPASPRRWLRWSKGGLGAAIFLLVTLNWYGAPHFQIAPVAYAGNLISAVEFNYNREDYPPKPPLEYREQAAKNAPSMVMVIGESLNVDHMQIYGYPRQTTPNLVRMEHNNQVVALKNAVSIGPRTLCSVPYMMTGLQGVDPHGIIYSTPTIFNYAKSAGYNTALITAQDFQWRNIDKIFVDQDMDHFEQGIHFSPDVSVSVGANDKVVLEKGIKPWLERQQDAPFMLVVQMSGSHTPFSRQVPEDMKQFLPEENPNSINAYDNTVWYTDHVLNELFKAVRAKAPDAWIFYSSDHGEHVTGEGGGFHGDFMDEVTHNSLLVFPPASALETIKGQEHAPVSQADIFATMLELMQVEPVTPIDGLSLLQPIPEDRMRVVTAFMKTLHNDPRAALIFPDRSLYEVDFERRNVKLADAETVIPYDRLDAKYRAIFDRRLERPEGIE
ncbi:Phosphoethanolamine transferase for glucans (OPG), alkaline phosphatase superfamily [Marinobacterium sediminicola]|uniref:Phosphoethanolamine transferase for glucans (OPG), alkaline phosphatase superfamily n=2 Tax=Marinobacterium sediminicola TaxID=518898 RepID=A0ABY1RVZ7_9GAMM|nr:Phosphoethanolamine transferase for glucans (OPG), alkaline phosphatase superfamily [Marinobacterium sediminicola]